MKSTLADWRADGKVRAPVGARRQRFGPAATKRSGWAGWHYRRTDRPAGDELQKLAEEVQSGGFKHVLLLGMGGSSLCPEVLRMTFGKIAGYPDLHVLDSTDPAQVKSFEQQIDIAKTLFIVSSKSGSTLEPNIFKQYFFERAKQVVGAAKAGSRFIAITDPGSKMQQVAEERSISATSSSDVPSIGGRYSALVELRHGAGGGYGPGRRKSSLDRTAEMVAACASGVRSKKIPARRSALILGTRREGWARQGHDYHFSGNF